MPKNKDVKEKTQADGNDPDRMTPGNSTIPMPADGSGETPVTTGKKIDSTKVSTVHGPAGGTK
jgi:hypothetical protein